MATPRKKVKGKKRIGPRAVALKEVLKGREAEITDTGSYAIVGGRPTKYRKEFPQMILDYIQEKIEAGRVPYAEEIRVKHIDVSTETWATWVKNYPEFSKAHKKLLEAQKFMLLDGGVRNKLNVVGTIFQLKVNHGMIETSRKEVDNNVSFSWGSGKGGGDDKQLPKNSSNKTSTHNNDSIVEAEVVE